MEKHPFWPQSLLKSLPKNVVFIFSKMLNWFFVVVYVQFFSSGNPLQYRSFFERWQFSPWQNFCPSTIFWAVWLIGDFLCQPCHNGGLNKKEKINAQQCAVQYSRDKKGKILLKKKNLFQLDFSRRKSCACITWEFFQHFF